VLAVEDAEQMGTKILVFIKVFYAGHQARQAYNGCAACYNVEARSERDQAGRGMAFSGLNRTFGYDKDQADARTITGTVLLHLQGLGNLLSTRTTVIMNSRFTSFNKPP
jgi:hypothetical protein